MAISFATGSKLTKYSVIRNFGMVAQS